MAEQARRLGMFRLDSQRLAIERYGLGHIAQQREVGDVAGGLRHRLACLVGGARLRLELALEGVFGRQRVAPRQGGKRRGQTANARPPELPPACASALRPCAAARRSGPACSCRACSSSAMRCCAAPRHAAACQSRTCAASPARFRNLCNQATGVVLPPFLGDRGGRSSSNSGCNDEGRSRRLRQRRRLRPTWARVSVRVLASAVTSS